MSDSRPLLPAPDPHHLATLQTFIADLEAHMGWQDVDLAHTTLQLTEELGELVQVINVLERHPEVSRAEALRADAGREIVDCLNYLLAIANRLEVDLGDVFQQVNTTNQRRVWPAP